MSSRALHPEHGLGLVPSLVWEQLVHSHASGGRANASVGIIYRLIWRGLLVVFVSEYFAFEDFFKFFKYFFLRYLIFNI